MKRPREVYEADEYAVPASSLSQAMGFMQTYQLPLAVVALIYGFNQRDHAREMAQLRWYKLRLIFLAIAAGTVVATEDWKKGYQVNNMAWTTAFKRSKYGGGY